MCRIVNCALVIVISAGIVEARETSGAVITTIDGNGADTFVRSSLGGNNAANTNYGSWARVGIKRDTALPGNNRKGYIRFDISSVRPGIEYASLEFVYAGTSPDPPANPSTYSVYGLNDGHLGESWNELTITWNNAPGNNVSSTNGVLSKETTFLGTFDIAVPEINVGDVISFSSIDLIEFLQSDTNGLVTIIVTRQQQNFSVEYVASKEHAMLPPPALVITGLACPWDLDGNGTVGIFDLHALLAAWGTDPGGSPDFDGNGTVDILDLLTLLANWGSCA